MILLFGFSCKKKTEIVRSINNEYFDIELEGNCLQIIDEEVIGMNRYNNPPLNFILGYEEFQSSSNWLPVNGIKGYEKIYCNRMEKGFRMNLVSEEPIKVIDKNKLITLNLTPNIYKNGYYKIQMYSLYLPPREDRYDNENFDFSAYAYFDYLTAGANMLQGISPEEVLGHLLVEKFFEYEETSSDFSQHIRKINLEYGTKIEENENLYTDEDTSTIDRFIQELISVKIDLSEFIVNEYVLTEKSRHRINEEEKSNLKNILSLYENDLLFEQIDFALKNRLFKVYLDGARISVEIPTELVRKWDVTTNKPILDSVDQSKLAEIILHSRLLFISNYETNKLTKAEKLCTSACEITGTGIVLKFDNAKLILPQEELFSEPLRSELNLKNYPVFQKKGSEILSDDSINQYDSLITNFSGLLIPKSNIEIPIKDIMLGVKGKDIIMNNRFVSGVLEIKILSKEGSEHLTLVSNNSAIEMSKSEIIQHFKNLNLTDIEIELNESLMRIFFKKERE